MGPEQSSYSVPSRPRFTWDIRNVPWTDGKGNQDDYRRSVTLWSSFHDKLPDSNSNKIPRDLRGIMLQSQLFGRAKDLCNGLDDMIIQSQDGPSAIVNAVYKRDTLSVVSNLYQNFMTLLTTRRGDAESFRNFESRFNANVTKFNAASEATKLPEAITAFMLLSNSNIDNTQRVSVLAATSNNENIDENATTSDYIKAISYEKVASVLRQCDHGKQEIDPVNTLSANYANTFPSQGQRTRVKTRLSPDQLRDLKGKSQCRQCHKYGHWQGDHNDDGSIKNGLRSTDVPAGSERDVKDDRHPRQHFTFGMVQMTPVTVSEINERYVGPLLDDGAPYSGIGLHEFTVLQPMLLPKWNGKCDAIPYEFNDFPYWQYGSGSRSSEKRKLLGSININLTSDQHNLISIRHLIIDGSSQWLIGRNVTKHCNIVHINENKLVLPDQNDYVTLQDVHYHTHIPYQSFITISKHDNTVTNKLFCATAEICNNLGRRPWKEIRQVVDKVHKHVCGHSNYTDIKILLQRNSLWSNEVQKYLSNTLEHCPKCVATSEPLTTRKVSLSSLNREFNSVVCIDHLHLDDNRVFHIMDASSRYSAGDVVDTTAMKQAIASFESLWISPFWTPKTVLYDQAFENGEFKNYLESHDIEIRPIPPRRHNKNVIESKHRIIRDVYLRLKSDTKAIDEKMDRLLVQQALRISNDLYGNDVCSANELAKGYTRPIQSGEYPATVPEEIVNAHDQLLAKRKLTRILRSKACTESAIQTGDLVQIYIKEQHAKRGNWSSPKVVLSIDKPSGTITVPGRKGRTVKAAVEDVRLAVTEDKFAQKVQESIDTLDRSIDECIDEICSDDAANGESNDDTQFNTDNDDQSDNEQLTKLPTVGDSIDVYWPEDDLFYPGKVSKIDEIENSYKIDYYDGDQETLNLKNEIWKFTSDTALCSNYVQMKNQEVQSMEQSILQNYVKAFGHRDFMSYQAQGLEFFPLKNAYVKEEEVFKKTVRMVHKSKIPKYANIITSHVIYKVKINDDGSQKMKARIAPHGNKDKDRHRLKTDSATCPPTGIRLLLSLACIHKWNLAKIDFTSAFLQTGAANRDVYVVPPRESSDKSHYWLLLTSAYGLVNANAKWQEQSDSFLNTIGFTQLIFVPQLFYISKEGKLQIVAVKVVDDILFAGEESYVKSTIKKIQDNYELGTIAYGPGSFLFYGLQISQLEDFTISVHADDKLNAIECYPIDRNRRKQNDSILNSIEERSFRSVNSSLGWIGTVSSLFCSFYASYLQQKVPETTIHDLITQINAVRHLKKLGTITTYKRPQLKKDYKLSVVMFSDASKTADKSQLGYIGGLLIGELHDSSLFHTLTWSSHRSSRPVKSVGAAEILAAGEAIDESKALVQALSVLLNMKIDLKLLLDSRDLFESISTCRNSTDRSIRADVSVIRYEFETHHINRIIWIPGKANLADPATKPGSPLTSALQLSLFSGELSLVMDDHVFRDSLQDTG